MSITPPDFRTKLAQSDDELFAAQRLRYRVFVQELGGSGDHVDHERMLECDQFDPHYDHLLLIDDHAPQDVPLGVVGVYRLLRGENRTQVGQFYSEHEYDLTRLLQSERRLLELGRSCLDPRYRNGIGMFVLWQALAEYVTAHDIQILFGVASFAGTDIAQLAPALTALHHKHLAPPHLRVTAKPPNNQPMDLLDVHTMDRLSAMRQVPALIKAYLRLGGVIGQGAYVDHRFNTTDICMILDIQNMNEKQSTLFRKDRF